MSENLTPGPPPRSSLILATLLSYFVLYGPQTILPVLEEAFGVGRSAAALLISATLFPLAFVPFVGGFLIEGLDLRRILRLSLGFMGLACLAIPFCPFNIVVLLRLAQGLALALSLLSITTLSSRSGFNTGEYVATTILGGFIGRIFSEATASSFGWLSYFVILGAALLVTSLLPLGRAQESRKNGGRLSLRIRESFGGSKAIVYVLTFTLFFIFMSTLNSLPYQVRLRFNLQGQVNSIFYVGYVLGLVLTLKSPALVRWIGNRERALLLGGLVFVASGIASMAPSIYVFFGSVALLSGSMFFLHTQLLGFISGASENRASANGLYLFFYYSGGVLGSYLPLRAYEVWSWAGYNCTLLSVLASFLFFLILHLKSK